MHRSSIEIVAVPCLQDNYAWLVVAAPAGAPEPGGSRLAVVIDPGEPAPVIGAIEARGLTVAAVLATHHHGDHIGGIEALLSHPSAARARVYCGQHDRLAGRVPRADHGLADDETFHLLGVDWRALATPGHTRGATCYHLPAAQALFCGDTLFLAGCGRLLEGTAAQAWSSLERLAALPPETNIYCGHEYTEKNLAFAGRVLPADQQAAVTQALQAARRTRAGDRPTVPGSLARELLVNPFLRANDPALLAAMGATSPLACFAALRHARDRW